MSIGARQVASSFQYRSRTEMVSGGASSANVRRATDIAAARRGLPLRRKCQS